MVQRLETCTKYLPVQNTHVQTIYKTMGCNKITTTKGISDFEVMSSHNFRLKFITSGAYAELVFTAL